MRTVIWTGYGPPEVLQLGEINKPVLEKDQVLIKIHSTTVTAADCELRSLKLPFYISLPMRVFLGPVRPSKAKTLGQELAGKIEDVGEAVSKFKKEDDIFAYTGFGMGAYSEYICLPENPRGMSGIVLKKPQNISFEEAAAIPLGGLEALHFVRKANIRKGQKMLINGAGGSIGTYAVQLAKYFGARVTAVDSTDKLDMLKKIGADYTIDYTKEDFTRSGNSYDIIFDIVGKNPFSESLSVLNHGGIYLISNAGPLKMLRGLLVSKTSRKKVIFGAADPKTEDLLYLKDLIETGRIKPVIDRCFSLEQVVEAHRYVEKGLKKGNVVINI